MINKRRHGISADRNRIGLFLYAPGGRSGTQEREQDEQHEPKAEEARNVCSAQEIEAVRCCSMLAPSTAVKQEVHAEKEKEKDEQLAPALRVSKLCLGVLVENYPDARENCLPMHERQSRPTA